MYCYQTKPTLQTSRAKRTVSFPPISFTKAHDLPERLYSNIILKSDINIFIQTEQSYADLPTHTKTYSLSQVSYPRPSGWSFRMFINAPQVCIQLCISTPEGTKPQT